MSLRAVAFDLDGVLIDSTHNHWRSYNAALQPYGVQIDWPHYLRIMGMRRDDALRSVARDFAIEIDVADATQVKEQAYLEFVGTDPRPIVTITSLSIRLSNRLPVALVTGSYGPSLERVLPLIGLDAVFAVIVHGRDVEHGKPAPDGYLLAAERLGIVPEDCIAIEDSAEGVMAAKAAGMRSIAVSAPELSGRPAPDADLIVPDRSERSAAAIERYILARVKGIGGQA